MKKYSLLISEEELKRRTLINDNLNYDYILPALIEAQDIDLTQVLGQALLDELMVAVYDDTVTSDQATLLQDYITPFLAQSTIARSLPSLAVKLVDSGVVQRIADDSTPLTLDEIDKLVNHREMVRDQYKDRLIKYLCEYESTYPAYKDSESWQQQASKDNFSFGLGLDLRDDEYLKNKNLL